MNKQQPICIDLSREWQETLPRDRDFRLPEFVGKGDLYCGQNIWLTRTTNNEGCEIKYLRISPFFVSEKQFEWDNLIQVDGDRIDYFVIHPTNTIIHSLNLADQEKWSDATFSQGIDRGTIAPYAACLNESTGQIIFGGIMNDGNAVLSINNEIIDLSKWLITVEFLQIDNNHIIIYGAPKTTETLVKAKLSIFQDRTEPLILDKYKVPDFPRKICLKQDHMDILYQYNNLICRFERRS